MENRTIEKLEEEYFELEKVNEMTLTPGMREMRREIMKEVMFIINEKILENKQIIDNKVD